MYITVINYKVYNYSCKSRLIMHDETSSSKSFHASVCAKLGFQFSSRETGAMKNLGNVVGNRESMIDRRGELA